jgi:hypothetical protein
MYRLSDFKLTVEEIKTRAGYDITSEAERVLIGVAVKVIDGFKKTKSKKDRVDIKVLRHTVNGALESQFELDIGLTTDQTVAVCKIAGVTVETVAIPIQPPPPVDDKFYSPRDETKSVVMTYAFVEPVIDLRPRRLADDVVSLLNKLPPVHRAEELEALRKRLPPNACRLCGDLTRRIDKAEAVDHDGEVSPEVADKITKLKALLATHNHDVGDHYAYCLNWAASMDAEILDQIAGNIEACLRYEREQRRRLRKIGAVFGRVIDDVDFAAYKETVFRTYRRMFAEEGVA